MDWRGFQHRTLMLHVFRRKYFLSEVRTGFPFYGDDKKMSVHGASTKVEPGNVGNLHVLDRYAQSNSDALQLVSDWRAFSSSSLPLGSSSDVSDLLSHQWPCEIPPDDKGMQHLVLFGMFAGRSLWCLGTEGS
jgi:hypothetical protein